MSWLSSFLHPERGYQAGQEQLDKYYGQAQGYYDPYIQHGEKAYGGISGAMDKLLNPAALYDEWSKGYSESEAAKQAEGLATEHGLDAASSLGLMGSTPALQAIQAGTSGIVAQDKQTYLNDLMQKYMTGIGIGQDIYGKGATAAGQAGQNAMTQGQNSAQLAYGKTNAPGQLFGNLLNAGINLGTSYLTGGMGKGSYGRGAWSTGGG